MKRFLSLLLVLVMILSIGTVCFAYSQENHSSNDRDEAKKGDNGVYSYVIKGKNYNIYYIVDFDEGCVYNFCYGNGDTVADKAAIEEGTLNDVLIMTYHDGDDEFYYGLHFKYVNMPDKMIIQDVYGNEYTSVPTDLDAALKLLDKYDITDYTGEK